MCDVARRLAPRPGNRPRPQNSALNSRFGGWVGPGSRDEHISGPLRRPWSRGGARVQSTGKSLPRASSHHCFSSVAEWIDVSLNAAWSRVFQQRGRNSPARRRPRRTRRRAVRSVEGYVSTLFDEATDHRLLAIRCCRPCSPRSTRRFVARTPMPLRVQMPPCDAY